ncbi:NADH-quinone oxidoreductase subunit J [Cellulomonas dongxiuzhuiae]|uniref:NADH-quinone oxidoreductase subunit J n=1 Tax=Cellulomonas dongxiuzhuiae TaxID=2819979 RepID=A0ABX8GHE1_9CELL|nr:NADH-quinone oxidoreductase subunit J [Cellulomonas dongxiuzhuiae]MBO3088410.1 NADH-quinone oxidoreductase subunit J [Cellulomonas dongxiuzhuiae]MBO3094256.1 NADH-quinone oxidoreductase subunit J [Cellulomonas dongxiuzhuiae]QWC15305.1 NADH-quinone oxidoreductase subunit J [Cellulomonas dongxiuzhuiae]
MNPLLTALPAAAGALTDSGQTSTAEAVLFWVLAPLMVLAALGLLLARKAVHAALAVIFIMISLAFMYVAQGAEFLGVVQVVVYTGAVMMLFLFVLMLVGVDRSDSLVETIRGQRWIGVLAGLGLGVVLAGVVGRATYDPPVGLAAANAPSNPEAVAHLLFADHVLAMEAVGALLVVAALGALVLTHRGRLVPKVGQRERAERRLRDGVHPVSLPAPGVYARHNAMDVPALLPDGTPLESSVPRVLRVRGQEADAREYAARIDRVLAGGWAIGAGTFTSDDEYVGGPEGTVAGGVVVHDPVAGPDGPADRPTDAPTHDEEDGR